MKKLKKIIIALLLLSLVAFVPIYLYIRGIEKDALALAETGRSARDVLSDVGHALKDGDWESMAAAYVEKYAHEQGYWRRELIREQDGYQIYKWYEDEKTTFNRNTVVTQWRDLVMEVEKLSMAKLKLNKIINRENPNRVIFNALLWMRGHDKAHRAFETKAMLRFIMENREDGWLISQQDLEYGETTFGSGQGFHDVAAELGVDFKAHHNPIFKTPAWDITPYEIFRYASSGVSAADYDGDGYEDLLFTGGKRIGLYRNLTGTGFADVTSVSGLPTDIGGYNVGLFADFNNDGHRDLFLGGLTTASRLFKNKGDGSFEEVSAKSQFGGPLVTVASAVDYDNDGDLDLYYGRYLDPRKDLPTTLFYTRNGAGNSLLRNDGDFRFTDVTEKAGVREGGLTLGVAWGDIDDDGDQDLYVANDFGRNALFRNQGDGTFKDISKESGTLDFGFGMSATMADADNDGDLDIYTSNVHSGQRWYGQAATLYQYLFNSFKQGTLNEDWPLYEEILELSGDNWHNYGDEMVKGNSLFINDGNGNFRDVSEKAGANPFGWYWASTLFDFDNDGLLDIYAANGWITAPTVDDL